MEIQKINPDKIQQNAPIYEIEINSQAARRVHQARGTVP